MTQAKSRIAMAAADAPPRARQTGYPAEMAAMVAGRAVTDFQEQHILRRAVVQVVCVAAARPEARAHARLHGRFARVGDQYRLAFQQVDEFVLLRMRVPERRVRAGCEAREVDAEIG